MPTRNAVVIPDGNGTEAHEGRLTRAIHAVMPDAHVITAVNGAELPAEVLPGSTAIPAPTGFNAAVMAGLRYAVQQGFSGIVRMDAHEHPPALLPALFEELETFDVVVADLEFDATTLRARSADEYHNQYVIPDLLDYATSGEVRLSGAHGYMGFTGETLARLLPYAERAVAIADPAIRENPKLAWSVDTILVVTAHRLGRKITLHNTPAVEVRDRESDRCAAQTQSLLTLLGAVDVLLPPTVESPA